MRPEDAELVTEAKIKRLLEVARESYDVIVVDTSPFFYGPMLVTLDSTDELLLLCGLEVTTIKNVRLALQTLELLSFPAKHVGVVLNRANTKVGMKRSEVESALETKVRFEVPSDRVGTASLSTAGTRPCSPSRARASRSPCARWRGALFPPMRRKRLSAACSGEASPMGLHDRLRASGAGTVQPLDGAADTRTETLAREPHGERGFDPYAELKTRVHHACIAKLGPELFSAQTTQDLSERVVRTVTEQIALDRTPLTRDERKQLVHEISDEILGYGPIEPLLRDESVTEVMVNGPDQIYVERAGKIEHTKSAFVDDAHLLRIIDKIVSQIGRRVDEASPMVDARLPDGSRVNAIIPPLSLRGPVVTIRKFSRDPYTIDDLIGFGTLTPRAAHFLCRVREREAQHPHLGRYGNG